MYYSLKLEGGGGDASPMFKLGGGGGGGMEPPGLYAMECMTSTLM